MFTKYLIIVGIYIYMVVVFMRFVHFSNFKTRLYILTFFQLKVTFSYFIQYPNTVKYTLNTVRPSLAFLLFLFCFFTLHARPCPDIRAKRNNVVYVQTANNLTV